MLSENEEQLLRQDLRNRAPLQVVNPGQNYNGQVTEGQHVSHLLRDVSAPVIVAGQPLPPEDNRPILKTLGEDPELLERTKKFRRPKENMMQFHARTGLGAAQIRTMNRDEIERFLAVVEQNPEREVAPPEPRPVPTRFFLEV